MNEKKDIELVVEQLRTMQKDLHLIRVIFGISIIILALLLTVVMPVIIRTNWPLASNNGYPEYTNEYMQGPGNKLHGAMASSSVHMESKTVATTTTSTTSMPATSASSSHSLPGIRPVPPVPAL